MVPFFFLSSFLLLKIDRISLLGRIIRLSCRIFKRLRISRKNHLNILSCSTNYGSWNNPSRRVQVGFTKCRTTSGTSKPSCVLLLESRQKNTLSITFCFLSGQCRNKAPRFNHEAISENASFLCDKYARNKKRQD